MKPGAKTTEFWLAAVGSIVTALMALLVGYGAITSEQSDLWVGLILASAPVAIAIISYGYSSSRGKAKSNGS